MDHHHEPDLHDVEMSHSRLPKHPDDTDDLSQVDVIDPPRAEGSLPSFLKPFRWWIIHFIILLFVSMIVSTIVLDIVTGSGPH